MADLPHIHLADQQPADPTLGGLTALAVALHRQDLGHIATIVEQLERIVACIESIGGAIGVLSQCDDARIADIAKLADRLSVLEQLALVRDADQHSRRIGEL